MRDEEDDVFTRQDAHQQQCLNNNHQDIGGNNTNRNGRDDLYSKVKFTIPSFDGSYDADAYLD